jgi:hypothetical protein
MTLDRCFYPAALQLRDDGDGRTLVGPVVPWNVEARVLDRGRLVIEVFALAHDQVPLGLSIGFVEVAGGSRWSPDHRRVTRTRATLDHIAVVRVPAYAGAGVSAVRAALQPAATLLTLARLRG